MAVDANDFKTQGSSWSRKQVSASNAVNRLKKL
jgi:hypothetical protein